MGGVSRALVHKGTFWPLVHLHMHSAFAAELRKRLTTKTPDPQHMKGIAPFWLNNIAFYLQAWKQYRVCAPTGTTGPAHQLPPWLSP
jgi:hypothetical protein